MNFLLDMFMKLLKWVALQTLARASPCTLQIRTLVCSEAMRTSNTPNPTSSREMGENVRMEHPTPFLTGHMQEQKASEL